MSEVRRSSGGLPPAFVHHDLRCGRADKALNELVEVLTVDQTAAPGSHRGNVSGAEVSGLVPVS